MLNVAKRQGIATSFDDAISIADVQEALYTHVATVARNAIGGTAALEIAHDIFGKRLVESKPSHRKPFKDGLEGGFAKACYDSGNSG